MARWLGSALPVIILSLSVVLAPGCTGAEAGDPDDPELEEILDDDDDDGEDLYEDETFGGNGRTCETCHPVDDGRSGTLNPSQVQSKFKYNPSNVLFRHDAADVIGGNTFNRIKAHATILIVKALPPNVRLAGSSARSVVLARGIPTTRNTPALDPVLMYDGREPTLQVQAQNAIIGHAQASGATPAELDAIAEFQQGLFNRSNLKYFVLYGTPLKLPLGYTDSQKRGRRFFIADGQTDPDLAGESFSQPCGWCHSGDFLNGTSQFFSVNIATPRAGFPVPEGFRFFNILVSEINKIGNPVHNFEFTMPDGTVQTVASPDPGLALVTGNPGQKGFFKISTIWGISSTAPYFHDNSSKTLDEVMTHYEQMFQILGIPVTFTAQDKADIVAYMKIL